MTAGPEAAEAARLSKSLQPTLAGFPPEIVGAALADLLALLLAAHLAETPGETRKMRESLLRAHIKIVRRLVPIQEQMLRERFGAAYPDQREH